MKTLKKIALIIFAVAIQNIPANAGSNSVKAELNGLIPIPENAEEPVSEDFFGSKEKPQQKIAWGALKPISEDEEPPVEDVIFPASAYRDTDNAKPVLPLNQLTPISQEAEATVNDSVFSTTGGKTSN